MLSWRLTVRSALRAFAVFLMFVSALLGTCIVVFFMTGLFTILFSRYFFVARHVDWNLFVSSQLSFLKKIVEKT
jgi:hypothetical protein